MGTYSWRNSLLNYECHSVHTSSGKLDLHRFCSNAEGVPVFMVHGTGGGADSFIQREQPNAGLAPFLASHGFDVYVAELSFSLAVEFRCQVGLHQLILEEIPAHLAAVAKLRPSCPQFWLGHGLGSVLLASCYGRLDIMPAPVLGMVQITAARRCELSSLLKSVKAMWWQGITSLGGLLSKEKSWMPGAGIDSRLRREVSLWQQDAEWKDPADGYNYRAALQLKGMPPALYLGCRGGSVRGGMEDTRLWVEELGRHDVRIVQVAKPCGNLRNYNYNSILSRPEACEDHFLQVLVWLEELSGQKISVERNTA